MSDKRVDLIAAWDLQGGEYRLGVNANARKIWLARDGCGISGHYDRIHVLTTDGKYYVFPAHNMGGWRLAEAANQPPEQ